MRPNRPTLDEDSASRLLQGLVHPDDAPPGYSFVAGLLIAAAQQQRATIDEDTAATTVSAMVETIQSGPRAAPTPQARQRRSMLGKLFAGKALAAFGVVALTATGAAASTGALPTSAQSIVAGAASHVGLDLPQPGDHGKSAQHRKDVDHGHSGDDQGQPGDVNGQSGDHGMSGVVDGLKGGEGPLGQLVCVEASNNKCHSGTENPGKGAGDDEGTPSSTVGEGQNHGRGHDEGQDAGDDVTDPATPTTGSIETGVAHSGRSVGSSAKGNSRRSVD
jgi:hypothetical protein